MKRIILLFTALTLVLGCAIGGTLAWLIDKTDSVVNTFTYGDVDITLTESPISYKDDGTVSYGEATEGTDNAYRLIPGTTYTKDPTVTVKADSEDCYLFIKIEENSVNRNYLTYTLNLEGWGKVTGQDNVWYREVKKAGSDQSWNLIKDNTITINAEEVTKETMNDATSANLTFTAYAVQKANVASAADAWAIANPTTTN